MRYTSGVLLVICLALSACTERVVPVEEEATLEELNTALAVMLRTDGHYPENVCQLTNSPVLEGKTLPVLPAGQQLVIDYNRDKVVVILENAP